MSEPWALEKEEKAEEAWPSLCEKSSQWVQEETGLGYFGATKTKEGILGKCKKESAGRWIAQKSMLMGTRNEERHVPSTTCNPEKKALKTDNDLGTNTYEGKPGTLGKAARWTVKEGG